MHSRSIKLDRRVWIARAAIHGLAVIGCAYLISLGSNIPTALLNKVRLPSHEVPQVVDIYPDLDYPLRPAEEPWDISQSYPYPRKLTKTVSEGTWLRIATHPVLDEIVFDMLGDLYCMSTKHNGDKPEPAVARPFLTGIPFDKEAEFSADGSQLVFVSDAGFGVDNIWTMPYSTCEEMSHWKPQEARDLTIQQTNSTFRFFSSPAFHPTEPKLLATKWYLTGRPNGAGEIWEFPLLQAPTENLPERGGQRLVARELPVSWPVSRYSESQLGAEQARYTPSGKELVFTRNSKDRALGKFSYNKDVHAGINAVYSLDPATGRVVELVAAAESEANKPASPGGANMPRLSHDGCTLAFVRRVDDKSVLVLKDMSSGTLHYIWDGLTYDLSTIPAFMGAYPNYGWTGNDSAIVIWAQGKIWRVPVKVNRLGERILGGDPAELPFEARIELSLGQTRYSETRTKEQELANHANIDSLRGLRCDDEGKNVVFEAAGDNYFAEITTHDTKSAVVALPKPDEKQSCYAPSFVPNHALLLEACWDARLLTGFYLADINTNSTYAIQGIPRGRYVSPISNGRIIAYVRTGKDYMFGDIEETYGAGVWLGEISISSAESDTSAKVSNLKHLPSLAASQDTKLRLSTVNGKTILVVENPTSVVQYDLGSGQQTVLSTGKTTVEMTALARGGTTSAIAFRDFQHVWVSMNPVREPFNVWSKPGDAQTPRDLIRLSEIGGHDVTITGDGNKILWLLGSTLYSIDLAAVEASCRHATPHSRDSGACSKTVLQKRQLDVTYETAQGRQLASTQGQVLALINATLISMDPELPRTLHEATILIQGGEIIDVGLSSDVNIPKGSQIFDVRGGAVLPGFVDVHGHWGGFLSPYPQASWEMETFLGYGVTTIHNPASRNVGGCVERHLIEKGRMYGPRVFHTGDVLYGSAQPSVYTEINSRTDAKEALRRIKIEGGDASFSVKNYQLAARSARQRLLLEAAEQGMLVVPEGGWSLDWDLTYFIDGYTSLEHPVPVPELYDDVLSLIAASGSSYTPLAVMNYGGIFGQHWIHQTAHVPEDVKLRRYVKHDVLEALTEVKQAPRSSYQFFNTTRSTAELARRGVRTNVGAHGEQPIGYLFHGEMRMMALGGQEPYAVLRHATLGGATSLGLQAVLGSVATGKLADLVVYPPGVASVEAVWETSMHMRYVVRGGTVFAVEDGLVEVWPQEGRRQVRARINAEDEQM
ncbi:hypothetical protein BX600DRAFT_420881 [Xylariales sp. PMI_506]|nr:hypothetical protein BX600DRAFT_420881 [Xylariales sp. PMI_506]